MSKDINSKPRISYSYSTRPNKDSELRIIVRYLIAVPVDTVRPILESMFVQDTAKGYGYIVAGKHYDFGYMKPVYTPKGKFVNGIFIFTKSANPEWWES